VREHDVSVEDLADHYAALEPLAPYQPRFVE
jgi:hypothetical protein